MDNSINIRSKTQIRGFTLVELLVAVAIIGLLAALLLPALSRGKAKAHRIKCLNNLTTIGKALTGYGHDFGGRLPWQILEDQQVNQLGSGWSDFALAPAAIFSLPPMVREIGNAKVLLSPCDPTRKPFNEKAEEIWATLDPARNIILPEQAISYLLIEGGDLGRPTTVLAVTRNVSDCDLIKARWVGADEGLDIDQVMAGLTKGQGQLVMADGSAHLSNDADLGKNGQIIGPHVKSDGGTSIKDASSLALGCSGGFVERPIDGVINTELGSSHTFIFDKSGSMGWDDRMNQAKTALVDALGNMKPTKKFYVYFFNSSHQGLSGGGARFATRLNVATAQSWIKSQRAWGMTNPSSAISDAFERIKPDTIWILTDGMFNGPGGSAAVRSLINDLNKDRMVVVNTWGFHNDPDRVDRNLGGIASDNNGTPFFSRSGK